MREESVVILPVRNARAITHRKAAEPRLMSDES